MKRRKSKRWGMATMGLAMLMCLPGCTGDGTPEDIELSYEGFRPLGNMDIANSPGSWGELNTHDPSLLYTDGTYYAFSTDASLGDVHPRGIQVRRSDDMITWEYVGAAFADYEADCAEIIAHAGLDTTAGEGFWAPDVIEADGVFRMYFSVSKFGSSRSAIGLAEAKTPWGPYEYQGIVVKSEANASKNPNAIDPAICRDPNGKQYMSYGSFFGGIFITELGTDGFVREDVQPVRIAGGRSSSAEASVARYSPETGYWYLFLSYGSLSADYNIRVGRAESPTGPYLDAAGNDLADLAPGNEETIGTKLLGGHSFLSEAGRVQTKGVKAPGHCDVLELKEGQWFLAHHSRTYSLEEYWFTMHIRRIEMNAFGWPVVAPMRYHGETASQKGEVAGLPDGTYALVAHGRDNNALSHNSEHVQLSGGKVSGALQGEYRLYDSNRIAITLEGVAYDGVVLPGWDDERECRVYTFTAMSSDGLCIWGCTAL